MPSRSREQQNALRPFWSGTISFGLVSVPVALYPATVHGRTPLKLIDPDGALLRRRWYCPEHQRDIHPEHVVRGYELESGKYIVVQDEELESLEPRKTREIDLRQFVDLAEVSPLLFERGYFVAPEGDSNKAYRLLADVMERSGRGGIASFVLRDREYVAVIYSVGGILRLQTLRFSDEVRTPQDIGLPKKPRADAHAVAEFERTIKKLVVAEVPFKELDDAYARRLKQFVERKRSRDQDVVDVDMGANEDDASDGDAGDVDLVEAIRQLLRSPGGRSGTNGSAKAGGHSKASGHNGSHRPHSPRRRNSRMAKKRAPKRKRAKE